MRLLTRLLRGFIKTGTLELIDAHGSRYLFGAAPGPAVVARIHDSALHIRLALNPELAAAEAYMDGTLTFEGGSTAHDLLLLFSVNRSALGAVASQKLLRRAWRAMRRRHQANTAARAPDNARSHYDVPVGVYRLFLDAGPIFGIWSGRTPHSPSFCSSHCFQSNSGTAVAATVVETTASPDSA